MATWEDGPEYAPLERPSDFAGPTAAPLDMAPPVEQPAAYAPKDRPTFTDPSAPVAPLATLVPPLDNPRDPQLPFETVSSNLTSDSAWGALHWSPPSGLPAATAPGLGAAPASTGSTPWGPTVGGSPWPAPEQPLTLSSAGPPAAPGAFPAPGTPEWFSPGSYPAPPPAGPITLKQVLTAATPGLCVCLAIGGMIYVLAPIILAVALGLSTRVLVAKAAVRRAFAIAVGAVAFFAVIGAITNLTGFADWWGFVGTWSLVICWVMLGVLLALVYRGLKNPGPAPRRATWG